MSMAIDMIELEGNRKGPADRSLAKDFHRLMKNIDGMSGGQASLVAWDETDLKEGICVSIVPDSGLYKDGEFFFSILCNDQYPEQAPDVYCHTYVYHPNIEYAEGCADVCLAMLDDNNWSGSMTLEDMVQGLLFLMHNPNLEDPLSHMFRTDINEEDFANNVACSLDGDMVDGCYFERNRVVRGEDGVIVRDESWDVVRNACEVVETGECGDVVTDAGEVVVTDANGERKVGDENVITDGGKAKEGGVFIIFINILYQLWANLW